MEVNLDSIEKALKVLAEQTYKIILPYRNSDGSFDGKKIKTEISKEDMELLEAYDLATLTLEKQTWVPISERLPEQNKHVLLSMRSHEGQEMQVVGYLFYSNKERLRGFNGEFAVALKEMFPEFLQKKYVLAWQPLPGSYKESPMIKENTRCKGCEQKEANMNKKVKGFKVFNPDWTCEDFQYQYEVGKTYEEDVDLSVFVRGFHFCTDVKDCFNYHDFDPNNKVAEIIALGKTQEEDGECCTDKIEIVREMSWEEVLRLCNTGQGCTGLSNSGNSNSGNSNSGNHNSGNHNSGEYNSGNRNSGNHNSGYCNSGYRNTGYWNAGSHNAGDWNTGSYNTGDYNTGDWNMTSQATGCFNTKRQDLRFFDKEASMTFEEWRESDASRLLTRIDFMGTSWIRSWQMTEEEKKEHPEHETTGGYLKVSDIKEACTKWWDELSYYEKDIIKDIPNFNAKKFFQITGIEVE